MKQVIKKLILVFIVAAISSVVFTVPVFATAVYSGILQVTNNSTATTNVATVFTLNPQSMVSNGFAASDFSDVSITYNSVPAAFMPANNSSVPWCLFVPSISTASINYMLSAKGATGGNLVYFPGSGGMNVGDPANLELANNGAISFTNLMPANGTILSKSSAISAAYSTTTGNITATANMPSPAIASNSTGASNGVANFSATLPTGHVATDLLLLTVFVYDSTQANPTDPASVAGYTTLYTATSGANVRIMTAWKTDGGAEANPTVTVSSTNAYYAYTFLRITKGGTPTCGTTASGTSMTPDPPNIAATGNNLYIAICGTGSGPANYTSSPSGYGQVVRNTTGGVTTVCSTKTASGAQNPGVYTFTSSGAWFANTIAISIPQASLNFHPTSLPISNFTLSVNATSGNFEAWENGTLKSSASMGGSSIIDNSNSMIIGGTGIYYTGEMSITKAGTVNGRWHWQPTLPFTDLSGHSNSGVATFRETSSSAYVSCSLISFEPTTTSEMGSFSFSGDLPDIGTPANPSQMYTEGTYTKIPGADSVNAVLGEGGVPYSLWWYPFIYFSICIIGLLTYGATQGPMSQRSSNNPFDGSLLIMAVVMEVLIVAVGIMNPVPLWPAYLFPIPALAIIISRRHQSWG